jgi:hypothetical protein
MYSHAVVVVGAYQCFEEYDKELDVGVHATMLQKEVVAYVAR